MIFGVFLYMTMIWQFHFFIKNFKPSVVSQSKIVEADSLFLVSKTFSVTLFAIIKIALIFHHMYDILYLWTTFYPHINHMAIKSYLQKFADKKLSTYSLYNDIKVIRENPI